MATYKEIRGTQIEAVATDPSNPVEGQVWYNTTSNELKGQAATAAGAWASGGKLNTGRLDFAGSGTATAGLGYGGGPDDSPTNGIHVESYNGTSWTEVNDLSSIRNSGRGAGSNNTSAITIGGKDGAPNYTIRALTESYNGTNWTELNDQNTARNQGGAAGSATSALAFGGATSTTPTANTEQWNGTNWTEVNNLNTARAQIAGFGASNGSAIGCGEGININGITELWNGTNGTEVNDLVNSRRQFFGIGTATNGLVYGGETPSAVNVANTEEWNGTNWAETTDLPTACRSASGAGYSGAGGGMMFGGAVPSGNTAATNEWTAAGAGVTRTFTDS